jgi:hypothetical protein
VAASAFPAEANIKKTLKTQESSLFLQVPPAATAP